MENCQNCLALKAEVDRLKKEPYGRSVLEEIYPLKADRNRWRGIAEKMAGALREIAYGKSHGGDNTDELPFIAAKALSLYDEAVKK